jgi:hypothetical protein
MLYEITLDSGEYSGFVFCATRGYCGDDRLITRSHPEGSGNDEVILGFEQEHKAWEWLESIEADEHAFGTCAGPTLLSKLYELRDMIV